MKGSVPQFGYRKEPQSANHITLCTVEDGGHVWFREESSGIEATAACVDFFLRHARNGTAH